MAVKRKIINHYMESAPVDPFDSDSPLVYRVMALDPNTGKAVTLTGQVSSGQDAMQEYERMMKFGEPEVDVDPNPPILREDFNYVLRAVSGQVDTVNQMLRFENERLRSALEDVMQVVSALATERLADKKLSFLDRGEIESACDKVKRNHAWEVGETLTGRALAERRCQVVEVLDNVLESLDPGRNVIEIAISGPFPFSHGCVQSDDEDDDLYD